ncbi:alpha/beta fold hydrolase [Curtobacterium sp. A7_M15]|uniref:alpha/beta fold hydrolase n=1 Tax=Curtobacterium sp. A7_M15 TaxID=3065241 RepID=UPI002737A51B|nr:alpha/beta fold hydrolase [Curtobacterium sp. A7_M15]MDP4331768.1 alpha/beta fold hydrolase [Curtobacterium sp. A7_M15]
MRARVETVRIDGLPVRLHTLAPAGRVHDALGPTVVLVHGIGMSHRSFTKSQKALATTHRTVSVDLPGFGGLPAAGRRLSMAELGDLVVRAVLSRGAGELVFVGQSMGTQVVVEAARRHPDVVASVVLVGPVIAAGRRRLPVQALDLGRDGLVEGVRMNAVLVTDYLRSIRQYVPELRPMLRYRLEDTIADVTQPVLVVRGTEDPIARHDWSARVAATARRGALVELPGPHHVQERQPVAFAQLVGEFRRVQTLEGSRPEGLR